jgi:hypothetical protein
MKNYEYRMIDYDMFDEDMIREINGLTSRGWRIKKILKPMPFVNSEGLFIRIFFERKNTKKP